MSAQGGEIESEAGVMVMLVRLASRALREANHRLLAGSVVLFETSVLMEYCERILCVIKLGIRIRSE